uniref:Uncharacterized protein n=1 Tax=Triticum urartu TaxID=4572 RepID=A0A8R7PMB9_TRIUA
MDRPASPNLTYYQHGINGIQLKRTPCMRALRLPWSPLLLTGSMDRSVERCSCWPHAFRRRPRVPCHGAIGASVGGDHKARAPATVKAARAAARHDAETPGAALGRNPGSCG